MPTYEYRCPNGHTFDRFYRKISDAEATVACPVCGLPAERLVSGGAGLLFKGSGFYITDYGKDGKKDERAAGKRTTKSDSSGEGASSGGTGGASGASSGGEGSGGKGTDAAAPSPPAAPPTKPAPPKPSRDE